MSLQVSASNPSANFIEEVEKEFGARTLNSVYLAIYPSEKLDGRENSMKDHILSERKTSIADLLQLKNENGREGVVESVELILKLANDNKLSETLDQLGLANPEAAKNNGHEIYREIVVNNLAHSYNAKTLLSSNKLPDILEIFSGEGQQKSRSSTISILCKADSDNLTRMLNKQNAERLINFLENGLDDDKARSAFIKEIADLSHEHNKNLYANKDIIDFAGSLFKGKYANGYAMDFLIEYAKSPQENREIFKNPNNIATLLENMVGKDNFRRTETAELTENDHNTLDDEVTLILTHLINLEPLAAKSVSSKIGDIADDISEEANNYIANYSGNNAKLTFLILTSTEYANVHDNNQPIGIIQPVDGLKSFVNSNKIINLSSNIRNVSELMEQVKELGLDFDYDTKQKIIGSNFADALEIATEKLEEAGFKITNFSSRDTFSFEKVARIATTPATELEEISANQNDKREEVEITYL